MVGYDGDGRLDAVPRMKGSTHRHHTRRRSRRRPRHEHDVPLLVSRDHGSCNVLCGPRTDGPLSDSRTAPGSHRRIASDEGLGSDWWGSLKAWMPLSMAPRSDRRRDGFIRLRLE